MRSNIRWILASSIGILTLTGCETIPGTFLGAGTSAGVQAGISNTVGSIASHTYSASLPKVRSAALAALGYMQIDVRYAGKGEVGEEITAKTKSRDIYIQLEEISPNATRMSVTARSGAFPYDGATAAEILRQTECAMVPTECIPGPFIP